MRLHLLIPVRLSRPGSVTPLAVLSVAMLVGMAALALDGGSLLEERRHGQATADAAALAAAADLLAKYSTNQGSDPQGTAQASALATAQANGYSNDGVQSVVSVNVSPQNYQGGPNAGKPLPPGYAEVVVQYNAGRTLSNVFASGPIPVQARAVARGVWGPSSDGVVLLNLTHSSVLNASNLVSLNAGSNGLQINSNSTSALNLTGSVKVIGQPINLGQSSGTLSLSLLLFLLSPGGSSATINYGTTIPDPLRFLPAPDPVALGLPTRSSSNLQIAGTMDLYPGVYVGGITLSGSASVTLHANSDGTPGIYYLQGGGLNVSGSSSIQMASGETAGVMLYNAWNRSSDAISLSGSGSITINPPSSGPYKGLSIFQKRGALSSPGPTISITGSGSINVAGTVYGAYASASLSGQSGNNVLGGQYIVDSMSLSGSAAVNVNRGTNPVAGTRQYGLVE